MQKLRVELESESVHCKDKFPTWPWARGMHVMTWVITVLPADPRFDSVLVNVKIIETYEDIGPRLLGEYSVGIIILQAPPISLARLRDDGLSKHKALLLSRNIDTGRSAMLSGPTYSLSAHYFWE